MRGSGVARVFTYVCAALVVLGASVGVRGATTRVERHPYTLGMDAGHVCEFDVGGACFALKAVDRYVTVEIKDASGSRADALYQFTDRYGALHQTGAICGARRIRIPDGATKFDVFLQTLTASALACATTHGPSVATTGEIVATFEQGAPRRFAARTYDTQQGCSAQVPDSLGVKGVTDDGETVSLDLIVLLERVTKTAAQKVFAEVARSYQPLGIKVRVLTYRPVAFVGFDAPFLISQSKALYGGSVPPGADVVFLLTTKNIKALNLDTVAGQADCIGGVRYPNRAFAVGEVVPVLPFEPLPLTFYRQGTARTAAHEIGHLMGGQHEHANCVQGLTDFSLDDPTPCTLMSNFADLDSRDFGVLEAAVVRGHAVAYAKP